MSSQGACYLVWPSNRVVRDHLDPLMLTNSERALITVRAATVDFQVVEPSRHSVLQRTLHVGTDYSWTPNDPLSAPNALLPLARPPSSPDPLFTGIVDLAALCDLLGGIRDSRQIAPTLPPLPSEAATPTAAARNGEVAAPAPAATPEREGKTRQQPAAGAGKLDHGAIWRISGPSTLSIRLGQSATEPDMGNNAWQPIVLQSRPAGAHEFLDVESAGRELLGASAASLRVRETAHVSMRFATDLQDDLLDLSLFGSRCQIGVAQPDGPAMPRLTLLAQHKTGKHGVAILYQRVAPAPAEPAGGPRGKKSAAPVEGTVPTTVRRYGAPYFQVDMSDASSSDMST